MKYTMVKQFYNGALDNIYNFFFRWVDFGKLMLEVFWAFFDIWQAFFMIFWNFFMYFYYLLLFAVDRGAESGQAGFRSRRRRRTVFSSTPKVQISGGPNPIPAAYRVTSTAAKITEEAASTIAPPLRSGSAKGHAKRSFVKTILEFFASLGSGLKNLVVVPAKATANFFADKVKPTKEESHPAEPQQRSLISDYLKEYEEKRKAE